VLIISKQSEISLYTNIRSFWAKKACIETSNMHVAIAWSFQCSLGMLVGLLVMSLCQQDRHCQQQDHGVEWKIALSPRL